ncbi:hypothetical protein [Paraburkholderia sp. BCC1885]|uniref:hypothetical protein n=1 Tax=Paraburkholderia sp. BCC1885 TaxID=2562669 RepID=UPI0021B2FCB3|nr:hypothetical protein [Paraburkholderia sp. BCC1885]
MHEEIVVEENHDVEVGRYVVQCRITLRGTAGLSLDQEQAGPSRQAARVLVRYARDDDQVRLYRLQIDAFDNVPEQFGAAARGEDHANFRFIAR